MFGWSEQMLWRYSAFLKQDAFSAPFSCTPWDQWCAPVRWRERFPTSGPTRVVVCADRENEGSYLTFVEFASYQEAMANNDDPATAEFAERMQALSDGPPTFHNLDIINVENRS
jgi:hypothetical protein